MSRMDYERYSQGVCALSEAPIRGIASWKEQWVVPFSPAMPKEIVSQFDRTDLRLRRAREVVFDFGLTLEVLTVTMSITISEFIKNLLNEFKKRELRQLIAFSYTIETDPERLRKLREATGESRYSCYILWLTNRPFDALPDAYKSVEIELYRLARYNSDVNVAILDSTKYPIVVATLMKALEIDTLPALVVSSDPIDLENPKKENTIVFRSGALERLVNQGKLLQVISNICREALEKAMKKIGKGR